MPKGKILTIEIEVPTNVTVVTEHRSDPYTIAWSPLEAPRITVSLEALLVGSYLCIAKAIDEER